MLEESLVPTNLLTVTTSHNPADALNLINNRLVSWSTQLRQEEGMWVQIKLKDPKWLSRIVLVYNQYHTDRAPRLNIEVKSAGQWLLVGDHVAGDIDPFEFENGKPVYDRYVQVIRGEPVFADGLRLTIVENDPRYWWTFMQIKLYARSAPSEAGSPPYK